MKGNFSNLQLYLKKKKLSTIVIHFIYIWKEH